MLETLNNFCTLVMDYVLGWTLSLLPRDLILLLVAILTSVILTGVRSFTTNQGMLKRMKDDKARLAQLIREAKARRDKEAVKRYKGTVQLIGVRSFKYEGMPLLASIVPIAFLAVWAFSRLAYMAPAEGQKIRLTVDFPAYASGDTVKLMPQDGMTVEGGNWDRQIKTAAQHFDTHGRLPVVLWGDHPDPEHPSNKKQAEEQARKFQAAAPASQPATPKPGPASAESVPPAAGSRPTTLASRPAAAASRPKNAEANAPKRGAADPNAPAAAPETGETVERAVWVVTCKKNPKAYPLLIRYRGQTLDHELIVDGKTYYSPVGTWGEGGEVNLQMDLPEYKFLGFIPSLDFYWNGQCVVPLDAWLLGYLVIVIPLALILKPVMHIY